MKAQTRELFAALLAGKDVRYLVDDQGARTEVDGEAIALGAISEADRSWIDLEKITRGRYLATLADAGLAHLIEVKFIEFEASLVTNVSESVLMVNVSFKEGPSIPVYMAGHWISRINVMLRDGRRLKLYPESGAYVLRSN